MRGSPSDRVTMLLMQRSAARADPTQGAHKRRLGVAGCLPQLTARDRHLVGRVI